MPGKQNGWNISIQKSIFIKPGKQKDNNIYMTFISSLISTFMNESLTGMDWYVNGLRFMALTELIWRLEGKQIKMWMHLHHCHKHNTMCSLQSCQCGFSFWVLTNRIVNWHFKTQLLLRCFNLSVEEDKSLNVIYHEWLLVRTLKAQAWSKYSWHLDYGTHDSRQMLCSFK